MESKVICIIYLLIVFIFCYYREGCYIIKQYNSKGRAIIVDAHDFKVATKSCDMIRCVKNQSLPVNVAVCSHAKTGVPIIKKKSKSKSKSKAKSKEEKSDDEDDDIFLIPDTNCRSRVIARELKILNEGDENNIINVDCGKCNECIRIRYLEENISFTQVTEFYFVFEI